MYYYLINNRNSKACFNLIYSIIENRDPQCINRINQKDYVTTIYKIIDLVSNVLQ